MQNLNAAESMAQLIAEFGGGNRRSGVSLML